MKLTGSCLCGALSWTFDGPLESATACNCTACRRYGTLWAYGFEGDEITVEGPETNFGRNNKVLTFNFCATCGNVASWRATKKNEEGKVRIAVNLRLVSDPRAVEHLMIDHFDGLDAFDDLPRDGRCIRDMWF